MKIWLYGAPFSGKTTFASQFEGAKILSTDGNADYLFPKEDIFRIKNYQDLDNAMKKLRANPPKWLVVDPTGYLLDYLRFYFLEKNKVAHESDIAYKGYGMLRAFYWETIVSLANLCDNIIFISHEQEYVVKNKFGREITMYKPAFEERILKEMTGLMTIVMRAVKVSSEKNESQYMLHIAHTDEEAGGTRLKIKSTEIENSKEAFEANFVK